VLSFLYLFKKLEISFSQDIKAPPVLLFLGGNMQYISAMFTVWQLWGINPPLPPQKIMEYF